MVSVTVTQDTLSNANAAGGVSAPVRAGYVFVGWATDGAADEPAYTKDELTKAPAGTTLYAVWKVAEAE